MVSTNGFKSVSVQNTNPAAPDRRLLEVTEHNHPWFLVYRDCVQTTDTYTEETMDVRIIV